MEDRSPEIVHITRQELEELADMAAENAYTKAKNELYIEIGRSVTDKFFLVLGAIILWLYLYFNGKTV